MTLIGSLVAACILPRPWPRRWIPAFATLGTRPQLEEIITFLRAVTDVSEYLQRSPCSDESVCQSSVQIGHRECVLFDEFAARFDLVAH